MKGGRQDIRKAIEEMSQGMEPEKVEQLQKLGSKVVGNGVTPKDAMGMNDEMIEGVYAQAYRLYNTGKYKEASQLFRLLIMLNGAQPSYLMLGVLPGFPTGQHQF
jgi:TolA-binding protein